MRRYTVMLAAVLTTLGLAGVVPAGADTASPFGTQRQAAPPPPAPDGDASAMSEARRTGRPVEVAERTTETRQVLANPNGTFKLRSNARPVRVRRDGRWRAVDTTLRANPNGTLAPAAAALDMTFSGGGTGPLIRLADGNKAVAFSWPSPLPTPAVSGDTATYPEVLPGVDLVLVADVDTYSETLVVRDAAAAGNPALANLTFTVEATNLTLRAATDGTLTAVDGAGTVAFTGSTPIMWDSTKDGRAGEAPSAVNPGTGRIHPIAVSARPTRKTAMELTLRPDPAALTGPGVTYPLYLDPHMSRGSDAWAEVTDNGWHYYNAAMDAQVGRCYNRDGDCGGTWTARSFFVLSTPDLQWRNGYKATRFGSALLYVLQKHGSHGCVAEPVTLWASNPFNADTRWPGTTVWEANTQWSGAGDQCGGAANVVFDTSAQIDDVISGNWATMNVGLRAPDEGNDLQWKKFGTNPTLEVDFSFPPNNATNLHLTNEVTCTGKVITPDRRPTFLATATDNNNPPLQPALWHHVWTADGSRNAGGTSGIRIASGTQGQWTEPNDLSDGDWKFRVYVDNNPGSSQNLHNPNNDGFSPWYPFTVRATPPAAAPYIAAAHDYPDHYWGASSGAPGAIAVYANGASNIAGYTYSFAGPGTEVKPNTADCNYTRQFGTTGGWIPHSDTGENWIPVPSGLSAGYHTVYVRSFDDAHNLSPETAYTFNVAPNTGQSSVRIEAETLQFIVPNGQSTRPTTQTNCCNVAWSGGGQLLFPGDAAGQSFTVQFPVTLAADYEILAELTKSSDYGQYSIQVDGQPIGAANTGQPPGPFDGYRAIPVSTYQPLGVRRLTAGTHTLTVTTTGTNSASTGTRYRAGLDFIDLAQTFRYEAENGSQVRVRVPDGQTITPIPQTNCCWIYNAWSQGTQLAFFNNQPNASFDLTFDVAREADYALGAGLTKAADYGKVTLLLDGKPLNHTDTAPWDGYLSQDVITAFVPLGGVHLAAGPHTLTVKLAGTNPSSTGSRYLAGVDYVSAVPVNNVTAASFTDAMNNDGIVADPGADPTLSRTFWTVSADSQELTAGNGAAANVIDGSNATGWHTQYVPSVVPPPHSITLDMHTANMVSSLRYQPRTDGNLNGNIGSYQVHVSEDGTTWGNPVAGGTFADNATEKTVTFPRVRARYVRLTALTEAGNRGGFSSAAELNLTGFAADGPAGFDLSGNFLSTAALAAAGYAPGQTATINGATFTMPAPKADGSDNVIATGQTIPFAVAQRASAVGLLVAATCGFLPAATGTLHYTDATTQNVRLAAVDDWAYLPTDVASFVLSYRIEDPGPQSAVRPRIVALFVPADPGKTVASITLPNYGTNLVPGSCSPALHVLAMAPRPVAITPGQNPTYWIGTWAAPADTVKTTPTAADFANQTIRSVIRPSVTGAAARVRISNPTSAPVTFDAITLGAQSGSGAAALAPPAGLTFGGGASLTLPAGAEARSDPVSFPATAGGSGNLLVSLHLPTAVTRAPIHAQTVATYLGDGNLTADTAGTAFTTNLGGARYVSGVEVSTSDSSHGTVAVLGDQLSAVGPGRLTWVDDLPGALTAVSAPLPGGLVNASRAGLGADHRWRLNDGSGTTAANSVSGGPVATLGGGVTWSTDRGGSVALNGTGTLTVSASVGTGTSSYTVSAWVKLPAATTAAQTVLSQDASVNNAFALQYTGSADGNRWAFTMPTTNTAGASTVRVLSTDPVSFGAWTHLVATYDNAGRTARLYVNHVNQGSVVQPTPFTASGGTFVIGRGKSAGAATAYLTGSVSDVRLYSAAAGDLDAGILHLGESGTGPQPGLLAPTATGADRTLDTTVLNEAQLRTVIVSMGANDILGGASAATVEQELAALMHPGSPTGLRNSRRTNQEAVHVIVTTVPPLGLGSGDPREAQRQALNNDLARFFTDYGADEIIDFAAVVRDSTQPNQVNPAYLSGGTANVAYHDAIARAIAEAVIRFPPEANL
jgi:hypothetical protein